MLATWGIPLFFFLFRLYKGNCYSISFPPLPFSLAAPLVELAYNSRDWSHPITLQTPSSAGTISELCRFVLAVVSVSSLTEELVRPIFVWGYYTLSRIYFLISAVNCTLGLMESVALALCSNTGCFTPKNITNSSISLVFHYNTKSPMSCL